MKIFLFAMILSIGQLLAIDSYSQKTKLSLDFNRSKLVQVLDEIENQTDFYFLFNEKLVDVNREVNIHMKDQGINEIMETLFKGTNVEYQIIDRKIVLSPIETVQQQQKSISGKVTDTAGTPLPGVTVVVKGTNNGMITDSDGNYSLQNVADDAILMFSFVGMKTQEIKIEGKNSITIAMEEETIGLEEVVAIGYGTMKKSDLTGSVASIHGNSIAERNTTQLSTALQGTMPGIMVTRDNNAPGSTAAIRIRGITTIGDSNPLVIVDGVPVNSINDINPNDVESISVLKDAASASIYGARAASGVILVTTKRAKSGELNLDYNAEYGIETPTQIPEYVDVTRYMQIVNELRWNDNGNNENEYPLYSKDLVDNYTSLNAENPDLYPYTDWTDIILNKYAPRQSHTLSVSAGTNAIRSKITLAYDKTDALYDGRTFERITSRFNNDVTINRFLSAAFDIYFKRSINKAPWYDPIPNMMIMPPEYAAKWSDGRVAEGRSGINPYGEMKYGGFRNNWNNQVGGKASINFTPINGLILSAIVSPTLGIEKIKNFNKEIPYTDWDDPTLYKGTLQSATSTNLYENRNDNYQVTWQLLVNYSKSSGKHNINLLGGYESYYAYYENLGASREQYDLTSYSYLNLGPLTYRGNDGSAYENAYRSYFGRLIYNYDNKYFLQGNIRYDASSRFHKDYRWGAFPSFSAGWVMSEESFFNNITSISFLKFRGSWGNLGNERIGNYPYQATIAFDNALFYQGPNVVSSQTAAQTQYAIKDISWEKTETIDVGLDVGFFDNKIQLTGDYYRKTTKDMLLALEIPDYIGFDNPDQNTGKMNTKGWETEVSYHNRIGELNYSVRFNLSDFKSKMGDLGGTEFIGDKVKKKGSEFNEWYGYKSDGLFQTQEEVDNSPTLNSSVKPGDVKYVDISGAEGIPDGKITPEYDRVLLGGSLPRYMYGGNIRLDYKGFDFSIVIQGVGKQKVFFEDVMVLPVARNWGHIPKIYDGNYWSTYNTPEENLKVKYPRMSQNSSEGNYSTLSDYWLISSAYLRMKNITLGYTLPPNIMKEINIQSIRIYGSVSDLFTIDNMPKGWDPEVSLYSYPITSSFVFGLSVKF